MEGCGQVTGITNVIDVFRSETLLAGRNTGSGRGCPVFKIGFERNHSCHGKEERWVFRDQRVRWQDERTFGCEEIEVCATQFTSFHSLKSISPALPVSFTPKSTIKPVFG